MNIPNNQNNQNNNNNGKKPEYITLNSFSVPRARVLQNNSVTFDIVLNGVTIYGCWVKTDSNGVDFIGWPCRKGSDDKYYKIAYANISPEDTKQIMHAVEVVINE